MQFNFYITFLCIVIHNITLLSTVARKQVYALEAHKKCFINVECVKVGIVILKQCIDVYACKSF